MTATPGPPAAEPNGHAGLEGYPLTPPPLAGPVTFEQHWRDLTFIHWPVRPESIEPMYPPGTRPDVFADGMTYVGLIPFATSTKVGSALPLPYFASFPETNVRWPRRGLHSRIEITVGDAVEPTPLEIWLTARWGAHTRRAGRTWWAPIMHGPWPFRAADIVELDSELMEAAGVRPTGERLRALYSCGVRTRFGRRQLVG